MIKAQEPYRDPLEIAVTILHSQLLPSPQYQLSEKLNLRFVILSQKLLPWDLLLPQIIAENPNSIGKPM